MADCPHINWTIEGPHQVGMGFCIDCDQFVSLRLLFIGLKERMEAALKKLEVKLGELK